MNKEIDQATSAPPPNSRRNSVCSFDSEAPMYQVFEEFLNQKSASSGDADDEEDDNEFPLPIDENIQPPFVQNILPLTDENIQERRLEEFRLTMELRMADMETRLEARVADIETRLADIETRFNAGLETFRQTMMADIARLLQHSEMDRRGETLPIIRSPTEVENSYGLGLKNSATGSVVANTERVQADDRAKLMAHDHLQGTNSNDNLPSTSIGEQSSSLERNHSGQRDTVSVIDCSTAEPTVTIGVDIPQRSSEPINVTSPQNFRHKPSRHRGFASETIPLRSPAMSTGYFRDPPPMMPRGGIRPMPRDDYLLRYPIPFVPGREPHHMRPLVPIRVGPSPIRWRMAQGPNVQLLQHQRLTTVAGDIREEHNMGPFEESGTDPSYV